MANNLANNLATIIILFFAYLFFEAIDTSLFNFQDWTMTIIAWLILISFTNNILAWIIIPLRGFIWIFLLVPAVYLFWLAQDYGNFNLDDAELAEYGIWYWINVFLWSTYAILTWGVIFVTDTNLIGGVFSDFFAEREKISDKRYKKGFRLGEVIKSPNSKNNFKEDLDSKAVWSSFYTLYFFLILLIIFNGSYAYVYQDQLIDVYQDQLVEIPGL